MYVRTSTSKSDIIVNTIKKSFDDYKIGYFIQKTFPYYINFLQDIRNEVVYGKIVFKDEATILRNKILGVTDDSILSDIKYKKQILK